MQRMWVVPIPAPTLGLGQNSVIAIATIHFFDDDEIEDVTDSLLRACARAAGQAIEVALWRELNRLIEKTSLAISEFTLQKESPFDRLAQIIAASMHFEACTILLADNQHRQLRIIGTTGVETRAQTVFGKKLYDYGDRPTGKLAEIDGVLAIEDLDQSDATPAGRRFPDIVPTTGMRQFLGVGIRLANNGELVGAIRLRNKLAPTDHVWPRYLNALDRSRVKRAASILASMLSLVIEEARQDAMIERLRHDVDMPATMIRDYANYFANVSASRLKEFVDADPSVKLSAILADIESMAEIILINAELLHLSREDDIEYRPELVNICKGSVVKLCKMLGYAARRRKLTGISYGGGGWFAKIPNLFVDLRLFDIALYNLIHNAIKYSHTSTEVEVSGGDMQDHNGKWYFINVENYGIGVPESESNQVFKKYFRGTEAKRTAAGGVGIGLHTARMLIELHGGTIVHTRHPNKTVFSIRLPASLAHAKWPPRSARKENE